MPPADDLVAGVCELLNDQDSRWRRLVRRTNAGGAVLLALITPAAIAIAWYVLRLPGPQSALLGFATMFAASVVHAAFAQWKDRQFVRGIEAEFRRRFGGEDASYTRALWLLTVLKTGGGDVSARLLLQLTRQRPLWEVPKTDGRPVSRFAKTRALVTMMDASRRPTPLGTCANTLALLLLPSLTAYLGWRLLSWPQWLCWIAGISAALAVLVTGGRLRKWWKGRLLRRFADSIRTFVPQAMLAPLAHAHMNETTAAETDVSVRLGQRFPPEDRDEVNARPQGPLVASQPGRTPERIKTTVDTIVHLLMRDEARAKPWFALVTIVWLLSPIAVLLALTIAFGWIWWHAAAVGIGVALYLGGMVRALNDRSRFLPVRRAVATFDQRFPESDPRRVAALQYIGQLVSGPESPREGLAHALFPARVAQPITMRLPD